MRKTIFKAAMLMLLATPLAAETVFQDWRLDCTDTSTCILSQTAFASDRTWVGTIQIVVLPDTTEMPLILKVPEGVHLASGLFFADGTRTPQQATWLTCDLGSCTAVATLTQQGLRGWKAANTTEIRYRPRNDGPVISFDVSLLGVTKGLAQAREVLQ